MKKTVDEIALEFAMGLVFSDGNVEQQQKDYEALCNAEDDSITAADLDITVWSVYENDSISDVLDTISDNKDYLMEFFKRAKEAEKEE